MEGNGRARTGVDRRTVLGGFAGAAGAAMLPGFARAAEAPKRGGTLNCSMTYNPAALDPITGRNAPDFNTLYALYDGLVQLDPKTLDPQPSLAKSWTWKDPKTLVLDLQENVLFHDGTKFDAEAVKFNIERAKTIPRSNVKADGSSIDHVEVTSPQQVVLHLNQPNAALLTVLADRIGLMVSPTAVKNAKGGNIDRAPVGTGPFKMVSWQDNVSIQMVKNDKYWRSGLPYLDKLNLNIINEQQTGLRSIIAGQNDMGMNLDIQLKAVADRVPSLKVELIHNMYIWGSYLNFSRPPFDNVKIRQALSWGLDRDAINKVIALGLDTPGCGVITPYHWACDKETVNYYSYQPDKARKLLAEAGHPDGIEIPFWGWSDQSSMQRQEVAISQLAKAGIKIKMTPGTPQGTSLEFFGPHKKFAGRLAGMGGYADPSQQYDNLFNKNAYLNASGIELPGYRSLYDATLATTDKAERKKAFAKLQRFVIENALLMTFVFQTGPVIMNKKVNGVEVDLAFRPRFHKAWLTA
jgi:peptide/nickel transport system substrate-binding protein/glutathione transport system substrate-binding protein